MRSKCPKCGNLLVEPYGPPASHILLVGDYPDYEDVRTGKCLSVRVSNYGRARIGPKDVLETELAKIGIQLGQCRYTNLWSHGKSDECEADWHLDRLVKEFKGKTHILLMGSDVSAAVLNEKAGEVSSLKFRLTAFPKAIIIVAPNPASVISGNTGEFRLALTRFKKEMKR